jgi:hypothetical protein
MTKRKPITSPGGGKREWKINLKSDERASEVLAHKLNSPYNRHGLTACVFQGKYALGVPKEDQPNMLDFALDLKARGEAVASGDLTISSHLLTSQAITLDAIFAEFARMAAVNLENSIDASERLMRLALKAQANSRATLEALARLHQPREQTVRHVHVNEGGQAIVADQFHNYPRGQENGKDANQPQAAGAGNTGSSAALSGENPLGQAVPIAGHQGEAALQDARR